MIGIRFWQRKEYTIQLRNPSSKRPLLRFLPESDSKASEGMGYFAMTTGF
jgi:hypothetical protein